MYTYSQLSRLFRGGRINEYSREKEGLIVRSRDTLHKAKGITLIESIRMMFTEVIRWGRLVLVIGGQESKNYSNRAIRLKSTQIRWFS
jgi:hypothetical protein